MSIVSDGIILLKILGYICYCRLKIFQGYLGSSLGLTVACLWYLKYSRRYFPAHYAFMLYCIALLNKFRFLVQVYFFTARQWSRHVFVATINRCCYQKKGNSYIFGCCLLFSFLFIEIVTLLWLHIFQILWVFFSQPFC